MRQTWDIPSRCSHASSKTNLLLAIAAHRTVPNLNRQNAATLRGVILEWVSNSFSELVQPLALAVGKVEAAVASGKKKHVLSIGFSRVLWKEKLVRSTSTHVQGVPPLLFFDNLNDSGYQDHESKPHANTSWLSSCIERRLDQIKRSNAFLEPDAEKDELFENENGLSSVELF